MTALPAENLHYTYEDYLQIEDEHRYEVLKGELIMVPAPLTVHQKTSINLTILITSYVREKKLGEVLYAPTDVVLANDVVVQPDILFIAKDRTGIIGEKAVTGAPDLIVEIVSPTSASYDTIEKRNIYEKHGVKEYWLIFPQEKAVEVLTVEDGIYREFSKGRKAGVVNSKVIGGLAVEMGELFE